MAEEKIAINIRTNIDISTRVPVSITVMSLDISSGNRVYKIKNEKLPMRKLIIILSVGLSNFSIKKSLGFLAITYPKNRDRYPIPITVRVNIKDPTLSIIGSPIDITHCIMQLVIQ